MPQFASYSGYIGGGTGGGGGVSSLNGETGAVNIVAGSGISVTPAGQNITIASTGGGSGTVTSVSGSSPIIITGSPTVTPNVTIQNADATHTGALTSTDWNTFNNKANSNLSNVAFTSIPADLIPLVNFTWNLGSPTNEWLFVYTNDLQLRNPANQFIDITIPASGVTSYALNLPVAQGGAATVLTNDGAGNLSWAASGSGANTALSNLITTSINQNLIPDFTNTRDLGQSGTVWNGLYIKNIRNSAGASLFNVLAAQLNDTSSLKVMSLLNRQLFANDGSTTMFDWATAGVLDTKNNLISNVLDPLSPQDAATKNYVDTNGANTALSNLTITSINQNLLPSVSNTYNFGSTSAFWNKLFVNEWRDSSNVVIIDTTRKLFTTSGTIAVDFSGPDIDFNSKHLTSVANPVNPQDAATKNYVDGLTTLSSLSSVGTITTGTWSATTIAVNHGGTGLATLTANNVMLGNGTSAPLFVAPGASGNLLTSNGTTWTSASPVTAGFMGSINWAATAAAYWSVQNASFTNMTVNGTPPTPTVTNKATDPGSNILGVTFANMAAGTYRFVMYGLLYEEGGNQEFHGFRFSDGTNFSNGSINIRMISDTGSFWSTVEGSIRYATPQTNVTIQVQAFSDAVDNIYVDIENYPVQIDVYFYPDA